jgi:hypothetical protein
VKDVEILFADSNFACKRRSLFFMLCAGGAWQRLWQQKTTLVDHVTDLFSTRVSLAEPSLATSLAATARRLVTESCGTSLTTTVFANCLD